jgi:hypothetical protein
VFYDLVENAVVAQVDGRDMLVVESAGTQFVLGPVAEEA